MMHMAGPYCADCGGWHPVTTGGCPVLRSPEPVKWEPGPPTAETIRKGAAVLQRMLDNARAEADAEIVRLRAALSAVEARSLDGDTLSRLEVFLGAVGASSPDDHPWVRESRALANKIRDVRRAALTEGERDG